MPNKTFNNLTEEKQDEIINISLKEFITHDYDSASLNQIINVLGIARGSFYRYFDSKRELYLYLIDYCIDKKSEYMRDFMDLSSNDFFQILKEIVYSYIKYNMEHSLYAAFLLNAHRNNDITVEDLLFLKNGKQIFKQLITKFQKSGQIDDKYDVTFILHCILQILLGMSSYIKESHEISNYEILSKEKIDAHEINLVLDQLINFFKNGFGSKSKTI